MSAQSMPVRRRESAAASPGATERPGVKNRAYSAPMVPKSQGDGADHGHNLDDLAGDLGEEFADDPFFQRINPFPQVEEAGREEPSSSSPDSSSDTEGPMSPTHIKTRQMSLAETTLPSPHSPAPSIAVGCVSDKI